jgi:DNA-binding HxlR family transcriptional regulator
LKKKVTSCAVETAMNVIGGRWRAVLLHYLMKGPQRFSELRRAVPNITQRMLTQDLRELERTGILTRTVFAEVPPRVVYELTPLGTALRPTIEALKHWGKRLEGDLARKGTPAR